MHHPCGHLHPWFHLSSFKINNYLNMRVVFMGSSKPASAASVGYWSRPKTYCDLRGIALQQQLNEELDTRLASADIVSDGFNVDVLVGVALDVKSLEKGVHTFRVLETLPLRYEPVDDERLNRALDVFRFKNYNINFDEDRVGVFMMTTKHKTGTHCEDENGSECEEPLYSVAVQACINTCLRECLIDLKDVLRTSPEEQKNSKEIKRNFKAEEYMSKVKPGWPYLI